MEFVPIPDDTLAEVYGSVEPLKTQFVNWYNEEIKDTNWFNDIPDCPDKLCMKKGNASVPDREEWTKDWYADDSVGAGPGHAGHSFMILSKPKNGHGQQCTYDANGDLIKGKKDFASGTADKVAHGYLWGVREHLEQDYDPYILARKLDDDNFGYYSTKYVEVREINQGGGAQLKEGDCCDNGPE